MNSLSICERSTRYVEADKIIKPYWYENEADKFDNIPMIEELLDYLFNIYDCAINTNPKLQKQQARDILPLCTVTEVAYIGFKNDWDWVIKQRTSNSAHPQAQELAKLIKKEIYERVIKI